MDMERRRVGPIVGTFISETGILGRKDMGVEKKRFCYIMNRES